MPQPSASIRDPEIVDIINETVQAVLRGLSVPTDRLREKLFEYFNRDDVGPGDHGIVMSAFAAGWLGRFRAMKVEIEATEAIWYDLVLPLCEDWENRNHPRKIHKGTLYYFWAISALERGATDQAFLLMHRALEEDQRESGIVLPDQPALKFARLDDDPNQFGYELVSRHITIVRHYLGFYNRDGGQLDFQQFRDWFLKSEQILEIVFAFAHAIARLSALRATQDVADTPFGNLLRIEIMFRLLQVVENALRAHNPTGGMFRDQLWTLVDLARQSGTNLCLVADDAARLARKSNANFEETLTSLVRGTFFEPARHTSHLDRDIALSYISRNQSAHRISTIGFEKQSFVILLCSAFNTLFLTVQTLFSP